MRIITVAFLGICVVSPAMAQNRSSLGGELKQQLQQQFAPSQNSDRDDGVGNGRRNERDQRDYDPHRDDNAFQQEQYRGSGQRDNGQYDNQNLRPNYQRNSSRDRPNNMGYGRNNADNSQRDRNDGGNRPNQQQDH
jgi:hypothetical protein